MGEEISLIEPTVMEFDVTPGVATAAPADVEAAKAPPPVTSKPATNDPPNKLRTVCVVLRRQDEPWLRVLPMALPLLLFASSDAFRPPGMIA